MNQLRNLPEPTFENREFTPCKGIVIFDVNEFDIITYYKVINETASVKCKNCDWKSNCNMYQNIVSEIKDTIHF